MNAIPTHRRTLTLLAAAWLILPALFVGCSPGYVLRAGWEEFKILQRRRPIVEAVHDTALDQGIRRKLRLVEDAREFAAREMEMDVGESFRSFATVPGDTLLMVVSAAYPYRLEWKTWTFPIVGRVPYRGYFDFGRARTLARNLREQGFDVYVRPSPAFSTLGFLPDPVLSTTLAADSVGVVETVIHETVHTTFFPAGQANFNESFANFVGHRGAVAFFCDALRDERLCRQAEARWHDTRVFGRFYQRTLERFRELYARSLSDSVMERRKRELFREAASGYRQEVKPGLRAGVYGDLDPEALNNAWLLGRILYYRRLDDFERVYRGEAGLRAAIHRVMEAVRKTPGDPWRALDRLLRDAKVRALLRPTPAGPAASGTLFRPPSSDGRDSAAVADAGPPPGS